jgi:serine/threonine-protein kinase
MVGSVFGTPHYMSPEQAAGTPLDHRGDIYSLGVMLYELATGRVPFDAENFVGILSQQLYQEPVPPREAAPKANIPAAFEAIILKCMAKKPDRRYQSLLELREELLDLEARLGRADLDADPRAARTPDPVEVSASVDGTALSTELTLASLRPRRWPMYAAIVLPVALVSGVLFSRVRAPVVRAHVAANEPAPAVGATKPAPLAGSPASGLPGSGLPGSVPPVPGPSVAAPPAGTPLPPPAGPAPEPRAPAVSEPPQQVLLGVAPTTAHVFVGERDLGRSPVSIDVPRGTLVTVEVKNPGYEPQFLQLDGSEARKSVELISKNKKKKRAKARRGAAESPEATETLSPLEAEVQTPAEIGGQLFVEPWQKP